MFGSPRKLPRIPQPISGPLPDGAVSISTLYWLQMLRQEPSVVFRLQSSRSTMTAVILISMDNIILV